MNNVMLDIETLGTKPGCIILSIGAIAFNPFSDALGAEFYSNINANNAAMCGFFTDPNTVKWWEKQSQQAKAHLIINPLPIAEALKNFIEWFKSIGGEKVWCHGATFDVPIVEHALKFLGMVAPWKYSAIRDTRTIYDIFQIDINTVPREGTYHNALHDAKHQASCIQKALAPKL